MLLKLQPADQESYTGSDEAIVYIGFDITQDKYSFVFCISPKDINKTKLDTVPELIKIISDNI